MTPGLVSIVLPVHNQAEHIGGVVDEYEAALRHLANPHEALLVLNACRDNSQAVADELARRYPSVRVIESERGGWGLAVKLGLQAARGDILCYTNSARTTAADLIVPIRYAIANPDVVVKTHRRSRESFTRKVGSFLYNLEGRVLFDLATWDINATPKAFSREIYEQIRPTSEDDLIDLEIYIKCHRLGLPVLEVPIYTKARHSGKSTTDFRSAGRMYWRAFAIWRAMRAGRDLQAGSSAHRPATS
ncbi:MAG: glycosyltransferase family 2 protein [Chloroflexi bacterium]|nr:glycosyltransferase family 2 protein [Chloroflexota bacterium]